MAQPKKTLRRSTTIAKRRRILPGSTDADEEDSADKVEPKRNPRPGATVEARENQLISLAIDLAARQIKAGTASSQVMTHFLKMGSAREKLERDQLRHQNGLLQAKTENLQSSKEIKALYLNALTAMQAYSGRANASVKVVDEDDED